MSELDAAVASLRDLWPDQGAAVLARAGLPSWSRILKPLPVEVLRVPQGPVAAGEVLLGRLRDLFSQAKRPQSAVAFGRALYDRRAATLGPQHAETCVAQGRLGAVYLRAGDLDAAQNHLLRGYQGLRAALSAPDLRLAIAAGDVAAYHRRRGEPTQAIAVLENAYRIRKAVAPKTVGLVAAQLGELRLEIGDDERAAQNLQEAWEVLKRVRGEHERVTLDRAWLLGPLLVRLDEFARAVPVLRSLAAWVEPHGTPEQLAQLDFSLGRALAETGHREEAFRRIERAVRWTREHPGEDGRPHPELPHRLATWSRMAEQRGRPREAEGYLLEAVEAERELFGADSAQVGLRQAAIGDLCARMGRLDDAIGWIEAGLGLLRTVLGDEHEVTAVVAERLIDLMLEKADHCFDTLSSPDLGWHYIEQGRWICLDILGPEHPSHQTLKYYRRAPHR